METADVWPSSRLISHWTMLKKCLYIYICEGRVKKNKLILENSEIKSELIRVLRPPPLPPTKHGVCMVGTRLHYNVAYIWLPFNVQRKCTPICTSLFYDVIFSCQREGADSFGTMSEFKFFNDRDRFVQRR